MIDNWVIDIAKQAAIAGLLFLVWYVYHRSQVSIMQEWFFFQRQYFEQLVRRLEELVKTVEMLTSTVYRVETKIDAGQTCHITKYPE